MLAAISSTTRRIDVSGATATGSRLATAASGEFIVFCSAARCANCSCNCCCDCLSRPGDVLRAEQVEDRTLLRQAEEIVGRQFVAEDIVARHVGTRTSVAAPSARRSRRQLTRTRA
jgi:hypothetical protein